MEQKTKVLAEVGKHEIIITRAFDLPIHLLFEAYTKAELIEQWMGNKVLKFEGKKHGGYQFETTAPNGLKFGFHGVIHTFIDNEKIIRTFEMDSMAFGVQLEVLTFEKVSEEKSALHKKVIYESVAFRDENLKLPFIHGINMAHNKIEIILKKK